ncbi:uncharacterized protein F5891DRAFT_377276 [Suillus fuscotomentosus]|uniref:Uncharacterized protein n=1 Tax=Suillus fuscotomentosus TaxID=1912939 RepID=A0AAD4E583_9AGAM|nr:uncharacterized protein F5891DRAFT_377276 [Suillus fuscotomentosus]KAG1899782.1 hypothetical protein F5891DRAFT_377276 [Suillus fuscotomentosus]
MKSIMYASCRCTMVSSSCSGAFGRLYTLFSENIQGLGLAITLVSENLRNDTKYITSWTSLGWTNDMITYASQRFTSDVIPVAHKK